MDSGTLLAIVASTVGLVGIVAYAIVRHRRMRKGRLERGEQWSATVTGFEFGSMDIGGQHMSRVVSYVDVQVQRSDGGRRLARIWDDSDGGAIESPGLYSEVTAHWHEGDRIEKRAGERYPRRAEEPGPFVATIASIDLGGVGSLSVTGAAEGLAYVDVVYHTDDGRRGYSRLFDPAIPPGVVPPAHPLPSRDMYIEVSTQWRPGDRIERSAGEAHPRRISDEA